MSDLGHLLVSHQSHNFLMNVINNALLSSEHWLLTIQGTVGHL